MELDQALFPNQKDCHGTHTITCPAWYVVEHNRIYKNGKNVWIDGYWKGALRDVKRNLDEGKERRIEEKDTVINHIKTEGGQKKNGHKKYIKICNETYDIDDYRNIIHCR